MSSFDKASGAFSTETAEEVDGLFSAVRFLALSRLLDCCAFCSTDATNSSKDGSEESWLLDLSADRFLPLDALLGGPMVKKSGEFWRWKFGYQKHNHTDRSRSENASKFNLNRWIVLVHVRLTSHHVCDVPGIRITYISVTT